MRILLLLFINDGDVYFRDPKDQDVDMVVVDHLLCLEVVTFLLDLKSIFKRQLGGTLILSSANDVGDIFHLLATEVAVVRFHWWQMSFFAQN